MATHRIPASPETTRWGHVRRELPAAVDRAIRRHGGTGMRVRHAGDAAAGQHGPHGSAGACGPSTRHNPVRDGRAHPHRAGGQSRGPNPATRWRCGSTRSSSAPTGAIAASARLAGTLPEDYPGAGSSVTSPWTRRAGLGRCPGGRSWPLAPFFGVMGVAPPPNYGAISTKEPREHGGNLDNKELGAGATPVPAGLGAGRQFLRRRRAWRAG